MSNRVRLRRLGSDWLALLSAVGVAMSACYQAPSGFGGPDAADDASNDASDDASEDASGDAACTAACVSDTLLRSCPDAAEVVCELGCATNGGAHCRQVVLSNGLGAALVANLGDYSFAACTATLGFSALGEITHGATVVRPAGTGIDNGIGFSLVDGVPVYAFNSLEIVDCEISLRAGGDTAFAAADTIALTRTTFHGAGPAGGWATTSGCAPGGSKIYSGGGGGGAGTAGAAGGTNSLGVMGGGGAAGGACASQHSPLRAGSSGGLGHDAPNTDAYYGLAGVPGAALQISARGNIAIADSRFYFGGGSGGPAAINRPSGGGGSGGTIFIEGASVALTGSTLFANGGNGGIPSGYGPAAGGVNTSGPSDSEFGEGRGGTRSNAPGEGQWLYYYNLAVGGGGAVGVVRVHATSFNLTGSESSPLMDTAAPTIE